MISKHFYNLLLLTYYGEEKMRILDWLFGRKKKPSKIKKSKKTLKKKKVSKKTYGTLRFQYKRNIKLVKTTQQRAIRDYNRYLRNFVKKHKRNPGWIEFKRIVRGASHETIHYRKGKSGHWKRQWVRQYIYGLHGIKYTKK
jgi:hypothetical protein